jgi:hypothetical protein
MYWTEVITQKLNGIVYKSLSYRFMKSSEYCASMNNIILRDELRKNISLYMVIHKLPNDVNTKDTLADMFLNRDNLR